MLTKRRSEYWCRKPMQGSIPSPPPRSFDFLRIFHPLRTNIHRASTSRPKTLNRLYPSKRINEEGTTLREDDDGNSRHLRPAARDAAGNGEARKAPWSAPTRGRRRPRSMRSRLPLSPGLLQEAVTKRTVKPSFLPLISSRRRRRRHLVTLKRTVYPT